MRIIPTTPPNKKTDNLDQTNKIWKHGSKNKHRTKKQQYVSAEEHSMCALLIVD